jgi:hypothetical protein
MIKLSKALAAWNTPGFETSLKQEIVQLDVKQLPLQQALSNCNYTNGDNRKIIVMSVSDETDSIRVKTGIFYTGIVAGCNCADDPSPVDEVNEYCEMEFDINKKNAETSVRLLNEI